MKSSYNPKEIEKKWQKIWEEEKAFEAVIDHQKKKFYGLIEFPYPSGNHRSRGCASRHGCVQYDEF